MAHCSLKNNLLFISIVMPHEGSDLSGVPAALKRYFLGAAIGNGVAIHGTE